MVYLLAEMESISGDDSTLGTLASQTESIGMYVDLTDIPEVIVPLLVPGELKYSY